MLIALQQRSNERKRYLLTFKEGTLPTQPTFTSFAHLSPDTVRLRRQPWADTETVVGTRTSLPPRATFALAYLVYISLRPSLFRPLYRLNRCCPYLSQVLVDGVLPPNLFFRVRERNKNLCLSPPDFLPPLISFPSFFVTVTFFLYLSSSILITTISSSQHFCLVRTLLFTFDLSQTWIPTYYPSA